MEDQRNVLRVKQVELEKLVADKKLTDGERALVRTAMEFAYAAAFCEARYDMNAMPWQAQGYQDKYDAMLQRLTIASPSAQSP